MSSSFNINVHNGLTFSNDDNSTLSVAAVSGTNTAGKNLTIAAGQGTGTGAGGSIIFQTADGGSEGSSANNLNAAMTIADDGYVGIGTTSPQQKLQVNGNIYLGDNDGSSSSNHNLFIHGDGLVAFSADGDVLIVSDANDDDGACQSDIIFGAGTAATYSTTGTFAEKFPSNVPRNEFMRILGSNGNVGIGTTTPSYKLHVHSSSHVSEGVLQTWSYHNGSSTRTLTLKQPVTNNDANPFIFHTPNAIKFKVDNVNSLCIDDAGNVGIGTESPSTPLEVTGGNGVKITVDRANGKPNIKSSDPYLIMDSNGNYLSLNHYENQDVILCNGGGNVGIGTTSPGYKLEVNGMTEVQNLRIHWLSSTGWTIYDDANGLSFYNGTPPNDWRARINNSSNVGDLDFTGQHKNLMNQNIDTTKVGLIVSATNNHINLDNSITPTINESLPYCVLSNTNNDKKVFGVISEKEDTETSREYSSGNFVSVFTKQNTNEQRFHINSVGEGAIWICNKNGNLESGDYITSTTVTGYGGKQILNEGFLMNYTVAKITRDCDFSLTKIVKQKLKVITSTDNEGNTTSSIDYDANGDPQYEDDLDENGNQQMVYPLETRFLQANGTLLTDEADYNTRIGNGEEVYIACFVGCTYHCG